MEQPKENVGEKYQLTKIAPTIDMTVPEQQFNEEAEKVSVIRRERTKNYEWAVLNEEMTYEEATKYAAELWKDSWDLPTYGEFEGGKLNGIDFKDVEGNTGFLLKKIPGHDFPQFINSKEWGHIDNWGAKYKIVLVKRILPDDTSLIV